MYINQLTNLKGGDVAAKTTKTTSKGQQWNVERIVSSANRRARIMTSWISNGGTEASFNKTYKTAETKALKVIKSKTVKTTKKTATRRSVKTTTSQATV